MVQVLDMDSRLEAKKAVATARVTGLMNAL
jgi:hypothetical protein